MKILIVEDELELANSIVQYLVKSGIDTTAVKTLTNAIPAILPENRKLTIKAVARAK